ncbi:hypothetical protein KI387_001752, partial [Taxus chinensis]
ELALWVPLLVKLKEDPISDAKDDFEGQSKDIVIENALDLNVGDFLNMAKQVHSIFTNVDSSKFFEEDIRVKPDIDAHGALGVLG